MPVPDVSAPVSNRARTDKPAPAPEIRNNAPTYGKMATTGNQPPDVKLPTGTASSPRKNSARQPENASAPNLKHNVPAGGTVAGNSNQPPDVKMPTSSTAAPKANSARNSDAGAAPDIKQNAPANGNFAGNSNRPPDVRMPGNSAAAPRSNSHETPMPARRLISKTPVRIRSRTGNNRPPRDVKMPAGSAAAPKSKPARQADADAGAAPDVGTTVTGNESDTRRLIALSANPAPVSPEVKVPAGNLSANLSISPEGNRPGVPGGASAANPTGNGGTSRPGDKTTITGGAGG